MHEGGLTHRIVDHVHPLRLGREIFFGVDHYFVGAGRLRLGGLLFAAHGSDHARAQHLGHLDQQRSGAARRGVDQARIARFERISGMRQVMRRHTLQHGCGGGLKVHRIGDLHQLPGRHSGIFGVRSARHGVSDAIARADIGDVGTNGFHRPRGFVAENNRRRGGIEAGAEINIDEIHARRRDLH